MALNPHRLCWGEPQQGEPHSGPDVQDRRRGSILASLKVLRDSLLLRSRSLSHAEATSGTPQACQTGFPRRANGPPSTGTDGVIITPRSPPLPHPSPPLPHPSLSSSSPEKWSSRFCLLLSGAARRNGSARAWPGGGAGRRLTPFQMWRQKEQPGAQDPLTTRDSPSGGSRWHWGGPHRELWEL